MLPAPTTATSLGDGVVGTSIRKFTLTSGWPPTGDPPNCRVLVEPSSATLARLPLPSLSGAHCQVPQPSGAMVNVPIWFFVWFVVPAPAVTCDNVAVVLALPSAKRPI